MDVRDQVLSTLCRAEIYKINENQCHLETSNKSQICFARTEKLVISDSILFKAKSFTTTAWFHTSSLHSRCGQLQI